MAKTRPPRKPAKDRQAARHDRFEAMKEALRDQPGPTTHRTPHGLVTFASVNIIEPTATSPGVMEIQVAGNTHRADPAYRVINPPRYVPDPDGDVEINRRRFREDPLAAVAYAIGQAGGARKDRRR